MQDFYKKWFDKSLQNGANTVINKGLGNYTTAYNAWKRIESIRILFQKNVNHRGGDNIRVLDVGCGDALPLFILNSLNGGVRKFEFYGIDTSVLDIAFAENLKGVLKDDNLTFFVGDAYRLPFQNSFFDIVICGEVLEHLEHPEVCLREIKRLLKDDGTALISTPNGDNPLAGLMRILKKIYKKPANDRLKLLKSNDGDEHINVRNIKAWKQTFSSMGFSLTAIKRHGILYGGYSYNKHRLLFALAIVIDWILDCLPFGQNFSEGITYMLKKSV